MQRAGILFHLGYLHLTGAEAPIGPVALGIRSEFLRSPCKQLFVEHMLFSFYSYVLKIQNIAIILTVLVYIFTASFAFIQGLTTI